MATISDLVLKKTKYSPEDFENIVGGVSNQEGIDSTDVESVFMPGMIPISDLGLDYIDQYAKVHVYNTNQYETVTGVKIYGYNVKNTNIVKFALEKNVGEEVLNRMQPPYGYSESDWLELSDIDAVELGDIEGNKSKGVWLRMRCSLGDEQDPLDEFLLGITE